MNYASIVPLIGGSTIAMQNVFNQRPDYMMTYDGFQDNEKHLINYYNNEVPYYNLSEGKQPTHNVDVVNTVCPCAGLSSLSVSASSTNEANDWMLTSAEYVLGTVKPKVFWGENAPRLASKMGEPVVEKLRKVAYKNGYTFSLLQTKSLLHGLSQTRDRSFYFFWKDSKVPLFDYIHEAPGNIAEDIRSVEYNTEDPMSALTNTKTPSDNPFYRYVLEAIEGGITHKQFSDKITKSCNVMDYIEEHTNYRVVSEWMEANGFEREAKRCLTMYQKLKAGGNIMRKNIEIPSDKIGAFVGHLPTMLTHPDEDRFLTVREALYIMRMPSDFELLDPKRTLNHICQNVPVTTAEFVCKQISKYLNGSIDLVDTDFLIQDNRKKAIKYQKNSVQLDSFMV